MGAFQSKKRKRISRVSDAPPCLSLTFDHQSFDVLPCSIEPPPAKESKTKHDLTQLLLENKVSKPFTFERKERIKHPSDPAFVSLATTMNDMLARASDAKTEAKKAVNVPKQKVSLSHVDLEEDEIKKLPLKTLMCK
jgi:hypothetical protein